MTTTTVADSTAVPLPRLGRCPDCPDEVRIRANGRLYAHNCPGDGTVPLLVLRPTFARWLWMQAKRRDDWTNSLTLFAGRIWRGCTRAPKLTAGDVDWVTAEELHGQLHLRQLARAGTELCNPPMGEMHDWLCRDLEQAAAVYAQLVADSGQDVPVADEDPGPVVRVHHRPAGWVLPDFTDLADCTSNFHRAQDGREPCTATAVWKVVEDHGMHLTIGFYCDADLPAEHRQEAA